MLDANFAFMRKFRIRSQPNRKLRLIQLSSYNFEAVYVMTYERQQLLLNFCCCGVGEGEVKKLFLRDKLGCNHISYYMIEPTSKYHNTIIKVFAQAFEQSNGEK